MISKLPVSFSISSVTGNKKFPVVSSIWANRPKLLFNSGLPETGIGVSYLFLPKLTPENITIDYSFIDDLAIRPVIQDRVLTLDNNDFYVGYEEFLITDVIKTLPGQSNKPLYFKHEIYKPHDYKY